MNTTNTTNIIKKTPFYNCAPLTVAFETIVYVDDFPRLPGDAEYRELLSTLLASEAASSLIARVINDGVQLATKKQNVRKCSGDSWNYAAADLCSVAFDLYVEGYLPELHHYVAANHVMTQIAARVLPTVCTRDGLELLRWLLRDNARAIVNLAVRQQELGWSH